MTAIERVQAFLKECRVYYLATVEGDQPRVRPFGTAEIFDGNQIVVNSRDDALEIAEYTNQNVFIQNLYPQADITKENFLYIPPGTSKLTLTDDSMSDITAYLEIFEEYDTI